MIPLTSLLALTSTGIAGFGSQAPRVPAAESAERVLEAVACPFDMADALLPVSCGRLTVPENYDDPNSSRIKVAFMVVKAQPAADPETPVLYLNGGPGGTSLVDAERLVTNPGIRQLVVDRDWVFFDQRGSGRSVPALHCPTLVDWQAVRDCRDEFLRAGVDLSQYSSARIASDVEALRTALGIEQWNLWGASYGSRLAFTIARYYPQSVRAIIHEAPQLPESQVVVDDYDGTQVALDRLFSKCAADEPCSIRYPDLRSRFLAALPQLRNDPLGVGSESMDDTGVLEFVRSWLFEGHALSLEARVQSLLAYMDAAARRDAEELAIIDTRMSGEAKAARERRTQEGGEQAAEPYPMEGDHHYGLQFSIDCNEEKAFESLGEYAAAAARSEIVRALLGPDGGEQRFRICSFWPSGRADPIENSHVAFVGPQLAFTGELDPSLSGTAGYEIAMRYPHATHIVFRNGTHGQVPISNSDPSRDFNFYRSCALEIAHQFLSDPRRTLEAGCAEGRTLRFVP